MCALGAQQQAGQREAGRKGNGGGLDREKHGAEI